MNEAFRGPGHAPGVRRADPVQQRIEEHTDYVRALARDLHTHLRGQVEYDELVALGNLGLVKAAKAFDPMAGAAFKTYAYYRIRGEMFDGVRRASWSRQTRAKVREQEAIDAVGEEASGLPVNAGADELARAFGQGLRRLAVIQLAGDMHEDAGGAGGGGGAADVAAPVERDEVRHRLRSAIERLDPDQRRLVHELYVECKSMADCAREAGVNKSTITRRHQDVVDSLRGFLEGTDAGAGRRSVSVPTG